MQRILNKKTGKWEEDKEAAATYWVVCHKEDDTWVPPIDCNDNELANEIDDVGGMVYKTQEGAEASARHQNRLYGLDSYAKLLE